jgi:hypothetical protein
VRIPIKLILVVLVAVAGMILTAVRRASARQRLAEFDQGRRCINCEGTDVTLDGDRVQCRACGHVASRSALARSQPTADEIDQVTQRDDRRL